MGKSRLEAFSDGVFAIIITIMVLELKVPVGGDPHSLRPLVPIFLCYLLSFTFIAIYWNNHHHLMQIVQSVNGRVLWANAHLLFWLSLVPFTTAWMGENHYMPWPVSLYGLVLLLSGLSYFILVKVLLTHHGRNSLLSRAVGNDHKGKISVFIYTLAMPFAFYHHAISISLYILVALMWLVPDSRIEKQIRKQ